MAVNNVLYLILRNPEGEPDHVAWARISPLVEALELAMGDTVRRLTSIRHELAQPDKEVGRPTAFVAGNPATGSLILPLLFEMPELSVILGRALNERVAGDLLVILGGLSDAASLVEFARDLLFGEWGVIGRLQRHHPARRPETTHERALDTVAPRFLDSLTTATTKLMEAAQQTGCESVHVRVNDQSEIALTFGPSARATWRLSRPTQITAVYRGREGKVGRRGPAIKVLHAGEEKYAFTSAHPFEHSSNTLVVVVWPPTRPLPERGETFAIMGEMIEPSSLEVLEDIPPDWGRPQGLFLVTKLKPVPPWSDA